MKVLAVVGSYRENSNTRILVEKVLEQMKGEKRVIQLRGMRINPYEGECMRGDGLDAVIEAMRSSDVIILGSPVYFSAVSAQMKALMDRTLCLWEDGALRGKVGAAVVVHSSEGGEQALLTLMRYFDSMGMYYAGGLVARASEERDILSNLRDIRRAMDLGKRIKALAERLYS